MKVIVCRCQNRLGVELPDGQIEVRHKGRLVRFRPPACIACEDCGHILALDSVATFAVA